MFKGALSREVNGERFLSNINEVLNKKQQTTSIKLLKRTATPKACSLPLKVIYFENYSRW